MWFCHSLSFLWRTYDMLSLVTRLIILWGYRQVSCVKYLAAYVELLTKAMTWDVTNHMSARRRSLGAKARKLIQEVPSMVSMGQKLQEYDALFRRKEKHVYRLPTGRRHTFTPQEVVPDVFITVQLAESLKAVSKVARQAAETGELDKHATDEYDFIENHLKRDLPQMFRERS